ncbi:phosphotransferase [Streptomyces sp. NBC_01166]|uniref:phosphotransferase n=1 Tax=Streptomyces sp. NBC_01166 TaxID=2903755 RepID=UPI00386BF03A
MEAPTAVRLAAFLTALRQFAPEDRPVTPAGTSPPGPCATGTARPGPPSRRPAARSMSRRRPTLEGAAPLAPGWDRPPVWFHGDFHTGNLLTVGGRLSADFGGLGIGDPACDLTIAFTLMTAGRRSAWTTTPGHGASAGPHHRLERLHLIWPGRPTGPRTDDPADHRGSDRLSTCGRAVTQRGRCQGARRRCSARAPASGGPCSRPGSATGR